MRDWLLLLLAGLGASVATPGVVAQDFDSRLAETAAPSVVQLQELAAWCAASEMPRDEVATWRIVLALVPDHRAARAGLGYELDGGEWRRPASWKTPTRTNRRLAPEYRSRRDAIADLLIPDVLGLLDRYGSSLTPLRRRTLLGALAELDPRNEAVRELLGERRERGRWLLVESVRSPERVIALRDLRNRILQRTPAPGVVSLGGTEAKIGVSWTGARSLADLKVSGTVPVAELVESTRLAAATRDLVAEVFGVAPTLPEPFTIYLLRDANERDAFIHFHPAIDDGTRAFLERLATGWVPGRAEVGIWAPDDVQRREWVARQTIALLLRQRFEITERQGALFEGVGLYLGYLLTGQRSAWYVAPSRYALGDDTFTKETLDKKDWFAVARRRVGKAGTDYRTLLSRDVNAMSAADLLDAWVFAAWLLEGRSLEAPRLLAAVGGGSSPERAVRDVFGLELEELRERVARWLRERR